MQSLKVLRPADDIALHRALPTAACNKQAVARVQAWGNRGPGLRLTNLQQAI